MDFNSNLAETKHISFLMTTSAICALQRLGRDDPQSLRRGFAQLQCLALLLQCLFKIPQVRFNVR